MELIGKYRVGDIITYRTCFGSGPVKREIIIRVGERNAQVCYDLKNGHWVYEHQIDSFKRRES